jgi:SAM-dependent methyltransferase
VLASLIRSVWATSKPAHGRTATDDGDSAPAFLNVGGGDKKIPVPPHYHGWKHDLLDIAARKGVDVVCDARELGRFPPARYDAVYCSHNLEHHYRHDVDRVLRGFAHVLKPGGFAEIRVPDIGALIRLVAERGADLDDTAYAGPSGPVSAHDMLWGYGPELAKSGEHHYAHKCGFTRDSLVRALSDAGFTRLFFLLPLAALELRVAAFLGEPSPAQLALLGIRA